MDDFTPQDHANEAWLLISSILDDLEAEAEFDRSYTVDMLRMMADCREPLKN